MKRLSQQELWDKIQNFNLDDPDSSFPFSKKLTKENNWSPSFTNKAIEEYKKFIFLCCISPTGASPSETVDEVWHLHLTYTDNYWNKFCRQTLGKEIHHHPSKGGYKEKHKHVNWYSETLQLYEEVFETKPPEDIWPPQQQVNYEITEPIYDFDFMKKIVTGFAIASFLYVLGVNLFRTKGEDFLAYYAILCIAGLIVLWFTQKHKEKKLLAIIDSNMPEKFNSYQIGRFLYGPHRSYQTALIDLLKRGIIDTYGSDFKLAEHKQYNWDTEENPMLQTLMEKHKEGDVFTYNEGLGYMDTGKVRHSGFDSLEWLSRKVDYPKFIIPGIVLLVGFARVLQGMMNHKPVAYLIAEIGIFSLVSLMILEMHSYTKAVRNTVEVFWERQNVNGYGYDVLSNFSIVGTAAIAGFAEYAVLTNMFNRNAPPIERWNGTSYSTSDSGGSSGGCGSSCSSGCGGGGCGGCGG